jgi:hypothetical protein
VTVEAPEGAFSRQEPIGRTLSPLPPLLPRMRRQRPRMVQRRGRAQRGVAPRLVQRASGRIAPQLLQHCYTGNKELPFQASPVERFVFENWCARQESNLLPCGPETRSDHLAGHHLYSNEWCPASGFAAICQARCYIRCYSLGAKMRFAHSRTGVQGCQSPTVGQPVARDKVVVSTAYRNLLSKFR